MSQAAADNAATLLIESAERLDVHRLTSDATIGRDRRCNVVVTHPTVSRSHARIYLDAAGWHLRDLGSQNGSKLDAAQSDTAGALADGSELRIGRVRAWFFTGAVPVGWTPPGTSRLSGKLIRCACGHLGWVPMQTADGHLRCTVCGRAIAQRDTEFPEAAAMRAAFPVDVPPQPTAVADCAACHTVITTNEPMHKCPDCAATMHSDCWTENRGCATYGCPQVGILDAGDETSAFNAEATSASETTAVEEPSPQDATSQQTDRSDALRQSILAVAVFALAGLPLFGVPPLGYAAYRLVAPDSSVEGNRRFVWAALSVLSGILGFACSAAWWLGVRK